MLLKGSDLAVKSCHLLRCILKTSGFGFIVLMLRIRIVYNQISGFSQTKAKIYVIKGNLKFLT